MGRLSTLELVVLGIVWKKAPCTAYGVRKEFLTSRSSHWSGSAGAIYPLMRRLESRGLLRSSAGRKGKRPQVSYSMTRSGAAKLRKWLSPPLPDQAAAVTYSPLRTRIYFLAALTPGQRSNFFVDALSKLRREIQLVKSECERYAREGEVFSQMAMRGALSTLRSQVSWIREIRKHLTRI